MDNGEKMRKLTGLVIVSLLFVGSIGCSTNYETLPAQVALLTAAVGVVEPDVCSEIPYEAAEDAAEEFIKALRIARTGCPAITESEAVE